MTTSERVYTLTERIDGVHQRLERARQLVSKVHPVLGMTDHYTIESSDSAGFYLINGACSCPDYQYRQALNNGYCKHRLAVALYLESNGGN